MSLVLAPLFVVTFLAIMLVPKIGKVYAGFLLLTFTGLVSMTATVTIGNFTSNQSGSNVARSDGGSRPPLQVWVSMASVAFSTVMLIGTVGGYVLAVSGHSLVGGVAFAILFPYLNYYSTRLDNRLSVSYVTSGIILQSLKIVGLNPDLNEAQSESLRQGMVTGQR